MPNTEQGAEYYDMGSSSQCYCHPRFLELETLGPKTIITMGETITHREVWRVFKIKDFKATEEATQAIINSLQIEDFSL